MQKTILIIEDDNAIRGDLAMLLTLEGYAVISAENGAEALKILRSGNSLPSVILLDIMMPVMDGWTFRATQVQDANLARIPVIVMTADGHAPQKAEKMNADGYVRKPVDVDLLLEAIARFAA